MSILDTIEPPDRETHMTVTDDASTDVKEDEPKPTSRMYAVPVKVLQAAAIAAHKGGERPILNTVAVYGKDLVVATDSYRLAIFGEPNESPSALIKRAQEANKVANASKDNTGLILVSVDTVNNLKGITPKGKQVEEPRVVLKETRTRGGNEHYRYNVLKLACRTTVGSIDGESIDGDYPNFASLFGAGKPVMGEPAGWNASYLADLAKINKLIGGSRDMTVVFHGHSATVSKGSAENKPAIWYMNGDIASCVYLLMPVRVAAKEW